MAGDSLDPEEREVRERIGKRLIQARGKMSQRALSEATGVPQGTISKVEAGEIGVDFGRLAKLERALGLEVGSLVCGGPQDAHRGGRDAGFLGAVFRGKPPPPGLLQFLESQGGVLFEEARALAQFGPDGPEAQPYKYDFDYWWKVLKLHRELVAGKKG